MVNTVNGSIPFSGRGVKDPHIGHTATCRVCQGVGGACGECEGRGCVKAYGVGYTTYAVLSACTLPAELSHGVMVLALGRSGEAAHARAQHRHAEADLLSAEGARLHAIARVLAEMPAGPPRPTPPDAGCCRCWPCRLRRAAGRIGRSLRRAA